jgi:hypothetical protein
MGHGVAGGPGKTQAQGQQHNQCEKKDQPGPAKSAEAGGTGGKRRTGKHCHMTIVAGGSDLVVSN